MQDSSYQPSEQAKNENTRLTIPSGKNPPPRGIGDSIGGAVALLAWDAALYGSFGVSFLVCPFWLLVSILKNAFQRPGWRLALLRIAIPAMTLGLVLANNAVQLRIAKANASRIIAACEKFHADNSKYPHTLYELTPRYMPSIPCAKYCVMFGEFRYRNDEKGPSLSWCVYPPYGRKTYDFEKRRWNYID